MGLGSAGEGCVQEHHGEQGRDERLQGRQVGVQLVLIQTVFSLLGGEGGTEQGKKKERKFCRFFKVFVRFGPLKKMFPHGRSFLKRTLDCNGIHSGAIKKEYRAIDLIRRQHYTS